MALRPLSGTTTRGAILHSPTTGASPQRGRSNTSAYLEPSLEGSAQAPWKEGPTSHARARPQLVPYTERASIIRGSEHQGRAALWAGVGETSGAAYYCHTVEGFHFVWFADSLDRRWLKRNRWANRWFVDRPAFAQSSWVLCLGVAESSCRVVSSHHVDLNQINDLFLGFLSVSILPEAGNWFFF